MSTKLYRLLAALRKEEFASFGDFLDSPYHNRQKQLAELFRLMAPWHGRYEAVNKSTLYQQLFAGRPYDAGKLNRLYSALSRQLEAFYFAEAGRNYGPVRRLAQRTAWRQRDQYPAFAKCCSEQAEQLRAQALPDGDSAEELWQLQREWYEHPETASHAPDAELVRQLNRDLDLHFLLHKLQYLIELASRSLVYHETRPEVWKPDLILQLADAYRAQQPVVDLYVRLAELFLADSLEPAAYDDIEARYFALSAALPAAVSQFTVVKLINLGNRLVAAFPEYRSRLFRLFQFRVSRGLLVVDGKISEFAFNNIVGSGAAAGEISWTRAFIEDHQRYLSAASAPIMVRYAGAVVFFFEGKYLEAQQALPGTKGTHYTLKILIQTLRLRCLLMSYLEAGNGYPATLLDAVAATLRFVDRSKKIAPNRRLRVRHFAQAVRRLAYLKFNDWRNGQAHQQVRHWIEQQDNIDLKTWLLETMDRFSVEPS